MEARSTVLTTPVHLYLLTFLACTDSSVLDQPSATDPTPPARHDGTALALARSIEAADELVLPPSSRPDGAGAPEEFGAVAAFEFYETYEGVDVYKTPLPVHSNLLPTKLKGTHVFGSGEPPGLVVRGADGVYPFARRGREAGHYGFDRDWLFVGVASGGEPPVHTDLRIAFPRATRHEDRLNRGTFEGTDAEFVSRNLTLDAVSFTGLFLPAPATARWSITVPERAVFTTRGTVVPPAIRTGETSDGATAVLELLVRDEVVATRTVDLSVESWTDVRWDLGEHAGASASVRIRTEPGDSPTFDYVFLEEPTIYRSTATPNRTVLVFVDTLRPDHLGAYGYQRRPTTPFLDRWAEHGATFTEARSVAPWTLPSARSALSGHQPEAWYDVPNVAERFAEAGYATEAIVANAFLSQPFDMHRGWTRFHYEHLWPADDVADRALQALERYPDRDLLLLVHFMDPHMPYEEPWSYRYRWAALASPTGEEPYRYALYNADFSEAKLAPIKEFVEARYDQNIRFVDDELRAVLEAAGPSADTLVFSDHGEEFWEHGSFEHGHSFYDEVLRVPLIVRSPHVVPGRYTQPVSILDIAPTALALAGLEPTDGPGMSLVDLTHGDASVAEALADRPQAFGRPLYEQDGWAVLHDGAKWIDRYGERRVYDLIEDPEERADIADRTTLSEYPDALREALDREVLDVWRLRPKVRLALKRGMTVKVSHPAGIREAWKSYDPRGKSADTTVEVIDGVVHIEMKAGAMEAPNAIFVVPNGEWKLPSGLHLVATAPSLPDLDFVSEHPPIEAGPQRNVLMSTGAKGWSFLIDTQSVPVRSGVEVSGFHEDVESQLAELGYVDPEGAEKGEKAKRPGPAPEE